MGQKSNLLTLRPNVSSKLVLYNSKLWVSIYKFLELFRRLLYLKRIWVTNEQLKADTNEIVLNFKIYYQTSKVSFYKERLIKRDTKKIPLRKVNLSKLLSKYIKSYGYNTYLFNFKRLNAFVQTKESKNLYYNFRKYIPSLFSRRFNLFIDFVKVSSLFYNNYVNLEFYLKVLGNIFKFLSKRSHNRYFLFVEELFSYIMKVTKRQQSQLRAENKYLIKGIKCRIGGRLQGKDRSGSRLISKGNIPVQTLSKKIDYSSLSVYTLYGAFGFKMWVHYSKI